VTIISYYRNYFSSINKGLKGIWSYKTEGHPWFIAPVNYLKIFFLAIAATAINPIPSNIINAGSGI